MVCPSYSNFSVGITLLHHNGSTVHGLEKIQQGSLAFHAHAFFDSASSVLWQTLCWHGAWEVSGYGSGLVCNLLQLCHLSVSCCPVIKSESKCTSTKAVYIYIMLKAL